MYGFYGAHPVAVGQVPSVFNSPVGGGLSYSGFGYGADPVAAVPMKVNLAVSVTGALLGLLAGAAINVARGKKATAGKNLYYGAAVGAVAGYVAPQFVPAQATALVSRVLPG